MHRTFLLIGLLLASISLAQTGDEWSNPFGAPATPPPKPTTLPPGEPEPPRKAPQPAPAPAAAKASSSRLRDDDAPAPSNDPKARAEERLKTATGKADPNDKDADKLPIVSRKETFLPGTEPHSPSTWATTIDTAGNARVTLGQVTTGTAYVPSARMGPKGLVRVGFLGEYLNQVDVPVRNAQNIRSGITFAASFQPFAWGEVYVGYSAAANTNNRTSPNLIQALGDLTLGIKASNEWAKGLHAGIDL